jgi:hypothetical protein
MTRGRVCRLHLLLALAITVILESESHGTRDHTSVSQIRPSRVANYSTYYNFDRTASKSSSTVFF